jgi:hypothetical protein
MARWQVEQQLEEQLTVAGDTVYLGLDMKTPDPTAIKPGFVPEAYNVRSENGGLEGRLGSVAPGYFNYISFGRIYGEGSFSDPNGLEWEVIGTASGAWFIADGVFPQFIPYVTWTCDYPVEFVQAFDVLFLFRGPDNPELVWHGAWNQFWVTMPAPTPPRQTIPQTDTAEYYSNRLIVPYQKDRLAISDILDYTEYDWNLDDFQINTGQSDSLVRVFPWVNSMVLVFKQHSIFKISNVTGDLTQTSLDQISSSRGLVSRRAVVDVGGDIMFMDYSGVYAISQELVNTPQVQALPLSDMIKPVFNGINWTYGSGIVANTRRERVYFAVPLRNASRNNSLLVYNLILNSWESVDTFDDPDFRIDRLVKMNFNGERRLFAIDMVQGLIVLLEQGKTDILGMTTAHERQIQSAVLTRGYAGAGPRNRFERVEVDVATWNPSFSVEGYVDGSNMKALSRTETADRTKYEVWNRPAWDRQNSNNDHATEFRQDYSVQLPVVLGTNGIQIERQQETSYRYTARMKGRYLQLRIQSTQGHLGIRSIMVESYEDQRAVRAMTSG